MDGSSNTGEGLPVWARPGVFSEKPVQSGDEGEFGFIDAKGNLHTASDVDELGRLVSRSRNGIDFVWTPASEYLVVPEEVAALYEPLRARQARQARQDCSDGTRMSVVFGAIMLWTLFAAWKNSGGDLSVVFSRQLTGLAAMLFFLFGLLPLYEGWKTRRHLATTKVVDMEEEVPDARFEAWLHRQRVPVTWFLLGCIFLCGLTQLFLDWGSAEFSKSVIEAGLLKQTALSYPSQTDGTAWWRMLTAPMLHGNPVHFLMNAAGILYLGRRTELLARWPHLLIVFVASMWVGGLASFYWIPHKIAVGASGGMMGLLGFMLVFETLHVRLVPKPARRRLLAGLVLMVVIGFLGMSFIDNAAHAGGLLAGVAYAALVFPSSSSAARPGMMVRDRLVGFLAGALLGAASLLAIFKIVG